MKAKLVSETLNEFHQTGDPLNKLNLGFGNHPKTKSFKILNFIGSKGEEGASFTEIQHYIWVTLNGNSEESFWEKGKKNYNYKTHKPYFEVDGEFSGPRKSRGYWTTNLFGGINDKGENIGILPNYCHKNTKGKWVLDKLPYADKNIY